jgi:hypothetical protein
LGQLSVNPVSGPDTKRKRGWIHQPEGVLSAPGMTRAKLINSDGSAVTPTTSFSDASPSGSNLMTHGNATRYGTRPRTAQAVATSERAPSGTPAQKAARTALRITARRASVSPATYEPNGPWPPSSGSQ